MPSLRDLLATAKYPTQYDADAAAAQRFVTSMLSTIYYARGTGRLEKDCFRIVDDKDWRDPSTTHDDLLRGGESLAVSRDQALDADAPFLYFRRDSGDQWLEKELDLLERKILPAIREKRLAQFLIVYSKPKADVSSEWAGEWEWVEYYSMIFRYADTDTVRIAVDWAGTPNTPIPSFEEPSRRTFKEFLKARPVIEGDLRIQTFRSFSDERPSAPNANARGLCKSLMSDGGLVDETQGSGTRHTATAFPSNRRSVSKTPGGGRAFIQECSAALQDKRSAGSGRIGLLWYVSKADIIQGRKELDGEKNRAAQDENRRQQDKERSLKIRPSKRKEQVQMGVAQEDDILDMSDTEPEWIVGASVLPCVNRPSSQTSDCNLTVFEADNDELALTQPLSTQPFLSQPDFTQALSTQPLPTQQRISSQLAHLALGKLGRGVDASPALPSSSRRRISGHVKIS